MTYISRAIEKTFLAAVRDFKVVLVTGPRQCGKTTMMKKMAEDENRGRKYISLDDFATRKMAVESPNLFLQVYKPPVFIDEVQYAPQLFSYIKIARSREASKEQREKIRKSGVGLVNNIGSDIESSKTSVLPEKPSAPSTISSVVTPFAHVPF